MEVLELKCTGCFIRIMKSAIVNCCSANLERVFLFPNIIIIWNKKKETNLLSAKSDALKTAGKVIFSLGDSLRNWGYPSLTRNLTTSSINFLEKTKVYLILSPKTD